LKISLVKKEFVELLKTAEKKTKLKKTHPSYYVFLKHNFLTLLNDSYGISPRSVGMIEGFDYHINHNFFAPTLDEKYAMLVHAEKFTKSNLNLLSEEKLEEYLVNNLHKIEEGLVLVDRQFDIENGRLDILAKDKNGNYCIIELKIEDDTDLCWQCLYYPLAVKERFKSKPRMIVVAKELSEHILKPLKTISGVEIYTFKAKMEMNSIVDLKLQKLA